MIYIAVRFSASGLDSELFFPANGIALYAVRGETDRSSLRGFLSHAPFAEPQKRESNHAGSEEEIAAGFRRGRITDKKLR
jgi:hypothetical protein